MTKEETIAYLQLATMAAEQFAPIASEFGAGTVANYIAASAAIAANVEQRAEEGKIVLNSDDIRQVKEIVSRIAATNDALAGEVAEPLSIADAVAKEPEAA